MKEGDVGLGALDGVFGVHLGLAYQALVQDFKRSLEHLQLTPKQTALLWLAEETPGLSQSEAARALRVDRATMLGITNKVVSRHLLERGPARSGARRSGRRIGLHLTELGQEVLKDAKANLVAHEQRFVQLMTPQEHETVLAVMRRFYAKATDLEVGDEA